MSRDNGGGHFNRGDPGLRAALRKRLGEDGFERWQRSEELHKQPRPLTDQERSLLRTTAAPVLADLAASGMGRPEIREEAHEERAAAVCAWIQGPGRTGEGIWVLLGGSPAQQVAELAEQFQDWAADQLGEAGSSPEWPACPEHPDPPHRLDPDVRDGVAVWACWMTGQVIWPIGGLERRAGGRGPRQAGPG
jgi:hypothetical protein